MLYGPVVAEQPKPNIIVIMSDDMGYSDIGCYGGEIETPTLDSLAADGIRFTRFYNTARCCPTRASLLTGLHPHQAGIGHMVEGHNLPGYGGDLLPSCVTIAEAVKPAGYSTYALGKWHVTRHNNTDTAQRGNWPTHRGFDRFYGTITGAGNYFEPATLVRDDTPISPFNDPEYKPQGTYYYTDAISDNAARYIREHEETNAGKPFFMYVAYTAAHWPMQALPEDIAKYEGKYDGGYDPIRLARFERMQEMGLINPNWGLSPKAANWDKVKNKEWEIRCMEVYAAMIDRMDQGIGRIVQSLRETGQYENTVIIFLQDNGACAENPGRTARQDYPERVSEPVYEPYPDDKIMHRREETKRTRAGYPVIHGPNVMPGPKDTFIAYGRGWANVSNTPFREYKHWVHEGGISTPLIMHAPALTAESMKGKYYREYGQLVDLMSTCVDLAGAEYPKKRGDVDVTPMQGTSLTPALQGQTLNRKRPLFWEHEGNRAVRDGKWKLVAKGPQGTWELYDMEADRSELHNLAARHPEIAARLSQQWENWAERSNVFPWPWGELPTALDMKEGVKFELRFNAANDNRKTIGSLEDLSEHRNRFQVRGNVTLSDKDATFHGRSRIEVEKSPSLNCAGVPWSVEAEIDAQAGDGVVVSQGGAVHGYSLYLKDGRPGFAVRIGGDVCKISAPDKIAGKSRLTGIITAEKKLVLRIDGKPVAEGEIPDFIQQLPGDTLIIGSDEQGTVFDEALPPFRGKMSRVTIYRGELPAK